MPEWQARSAARQTSDEAGDEGVDDDGCRHCYGDEEECCDDWRDCRSFLLCFRDELHS